MNETELKLVLSPEDADRLEAAGLFAAPPDIVRQRSIYFDTPEHALRKAGYALRIREAGGQRIQTVKAGRSSAGLHVRTEWERAVPDDIPVLDDSTPIAGLLGRQAAELTPLFIVENARHDWRLREGKATIAVSLDRGAVVTGSQRTAFCELELELQRGTPDALFDFARRVASICPLRPGVETKAERGYRLTAAPATHYKAGRMHLSADMTAAQAFQLIAQNCLRQFRLNEDLLRAHRHPGAVHQARVALRRLRSALSLCRPLFDKKRAGHPGADLRWLAGELGDARNLDVLLERAGDGALHHQLSAAREAAYDKALAALASPRAGAILLATAEWIVTGPWLHAPESARNRQLSARDFAARALTRFHRKVQRDGHELATIDDEMRHELRKDAKKLRYGVEFFHTLFPRGKERRRYRKYLRHLEALLEELGVLNDLATAPLLLEQLHLTAHPDAHLLLDKEDAGKRIKAAARAYAELMERKKFWG